LHGGSVLKQDSRKIVSGSFLRKEGEEYNEKQYQEQELSPLIGRDRRRGQKKFIHNEKK
jgi:hypothetical protein